MNNIGDVRILQGRQFQIVERGLDEKQVEEFIKELLDRLKAAQESIHPEGANSVAEAGRLVQVLGEEAQQIRAEAEVEASRIISEAESVSSEEAETARKIVKSTAEEARKIVEKARAQADSMERAVRHQAHHTMKSVQEQVQARVKESLRKASQNIMDEFERLSDEVDLLSSNATNRSPVDAEDLHEDQSPQPSISNNAGKVEPNPKSEARRNVELMITPPINPAAFAAFLGHLLDLEGIVIRSTKKTDDGSQTIGIGIYEDLEIDRLLRDLHEVQRVIDGDPIVIRLK
jgi:vacuolar-type H+-ATPase subunit E/Vma4